MSEPVSQQDEMDEMKVAIPTPTTIDPAFFTAALRRGGYDAEVESFTAERIGTGQIGQCIRYTLDFAGDPRSAPRSLVGKFASDDETSRQTGVVLRNFLKEVRFYQELQPRVTIRTPECYFAEIEDFGPSFALLLEDLAPARQGNQIEGCGAEVASAAVLELVGLHAPSWNDDSLRKIPWLGRDETADRPEPQQLYNDVLGAFFDRLGHRLADDEAEIIERVASSAGPPWQYPEEPQSLVHIDYRLDNLLIDDATLPPTVTVVDWQSIALGSPLADVAYFLGAGLRSAARRGCEERIVRDYHRGLVAAGVEGYDWDRCWSDYRRGVFAGFAVTVIASTIVVETERGNDMFAAMARRHARHALDLGSADML